MSLKVLMKRKELQNKKQALEELRKKDSEFEKREKELEDAVNELTEESTEEEKNTVQEEVDNFEEEKKAHEEAKGDLEAEINDIEEEIKGIEENQPKPNADPVPEDKGNQDRGGKKQMDVRTKMFGTIQERTALFQRDDVKKFLGEVRTAIKEKRTINNAGVLIPEVLLPIIRQIVEENSKLYKYVRAKYVKGTARQSIMGDMPEGIWTEMVGTLNELDLEFYDAEVDGYKVGGFVAISNAYIEDSDEDLAAIVLEAIGKAIGTALDKAIVYGKGIKMPLGIVTRLAQDEQPDNYPTYARPWKDLSESNIKTGTGKTGLDLFKEIVKNKSCTFNKYSKGSVVWIMNEVTHNTLIAESIGANMNAAIVAGMQNTMPVVGGDIVELDFIPDNNIVYGHLDCYILAERSGMKLDESDHARFIEDQKVFRGTGRYDGKPIIAEAFGVLSIDTTAPQTSATFLGDKANDATLQDITVGGTSVSGFDPNKFTYTQTATAGKAKVDAVPTESGAKIEMTYDGKTINNGAEVTIAASKVLTIKVTKGMSELNYTVTMSVG